MHSNPFKPFAFRWVRGVIPPKICHTTCYTNLCNVGAVRGMGFYNAFAGTLLPSFTHRPSCVKFQQSSIRPFCSLPFPPLGEPWLHPTSNES